METFKFILFGVAGLSMVFWVAVIAMWHTYMLPRLFKSDHSRSVSINSAQSTEGLRESGLIDRGKYSNRFFVIADFNSVEEGYGVDRLYTTMLISVAFMSFLVLTYGLHSGFSLFGIS